MSDPPGICVVTHPLSAAGENATRSLLEVLSAITTVSLVTADLPVESEIRERYEVVELTRSGAGSTIPVAGLRFVLNQLRMCLAIVRRDEPVVLFFGATAYLLPVVVAKLRGRTVVIQPRGDVPLTLRLDWESKVSAGFARLLAGGVRLLERVDFHLADAIVTYTPGMAEQLDLGSFSGKLYANGARHVDVDRFRPSRPMAERDVVVGFVGRFAEEKGVRVLAEVAGRLPDGVTFRFVGDGPLRPWLEATLRDEIRDGSVEVTGWVDHDRVPDEVSQLRLLVMPSKPTEGLPTAILEALACGTPVYATPVSGIPDVVREGETGFLMTDSDPATVAEEIERILDDADLASVSEAGRKLVEREYSYDAAVERYRRILGSIYSM